MSGGIGISSGKINSRHVIKSETVFGVKFNGVVESSVHSSRALCFPDVLSWFRTLYRALENVTSSRMQHLSLQKEQNWGSITSPTRGCATGPLGRALPPLRPPREARPRQGQRAPSSSFASEACWPCSAPVCASSSSARAVR